MSIRKPIFLLSLLLTFAGARAQLRQPGESGKWELSGFVGWTTASGQENFLTPVSDGSSKLVTISHGSGYSVGLRISENLRQRFGAELEYSVTDTSLNMSNLKPSLPSLEIEQKVHSFVYQGLVYFSERRSRLRPFGSVGAGASYFQVSGDTKSVALLNGVDLKSPWEFAFVYGGGVKWLAGRNWGVRFDLRDTLTSMPAYGLPRTAQIVSGVQREAFRPDGLLHNLQFTAGFVYAFDVF